MIPRFFGLPFWLSPILSFIMGGCAQKDLNDNAHTTIAENVEVVFNWKKVVNPKASSMGLYLYSEEHSMMDYWFNNPNGGIIKTYEGHHSAVCHSNDDPYINFIRNPHTPEEIEIFTETTSVLIGQGISTRGIPRAPGTEEEPLRNTPSMIYGIHNKDVSIKASALPQTLILYPEELVCHYSVEFVNVENLKNADLSIDATITSLAGGYYLGRMMPTSEVVSHTFTLSADSELTSLTSDFLTFGLPDGEERSHKICIYIALKNKTGNFYTFDVTDQVNNAPDPRNVSIKLYGLKLPELPDEPPAPPQEGGGVSIEIDSWDTIHFDLPV